LRVPSGRFGRANHQSLADRRSRASRICSEILSAWVPLVNRSLAIDLGKFAKSEAGRQPDRAEVWSVMRLLPFGPARSGDRPGRGGTDRVDGPGGVCVHLLLGARQPAGRRRAGGSAQVEGPDTGDAGGPDRPSLDDARVVEPTDSPAALGRPQAARATAKANSDASAGRGMITVQWGATHAGDRLRKSQCSPERGQSPWRIEVLRSRRDCSAPETLRESPVGAASLHQRSDAWAIGLDAIANPTSRVKSGQRTRQAIRHKFLEPRE
jgi:hypothetical protein